MLKLLEFDFTIEYKQGKENTVADALSRKHKSSEEACAAMSTAVPTWMYEIADSYINDPKCTQLLQELAAGTTDNPHYKLHSGIL